jgi:hypothetical protein
VAAARPQVGEDRRAIADPGEIVEREIHTRLVRDREQMQHGVRRAAERDDSRDRVLEGFLAQDVGGLDAAVDERDDGLAGAAAIVGLRARHGFLRGAVREAQAQRFDRGRHRVRRVHAGAGPGARDRRPLDFLELGVVDLARRIAADGFEDGDDVAILRPRLDRAAVDENRRPIEACHGHDAARHVLVAAADRDEAVEAFGRRHGLDRVGNDLARHERIAHPGRAVRDAVRDRDRIEQNALRAGAIGAGTGMPGQPVDVHVARGYHIPGRRDSDLGFSEVFVLEAHGPQHGAAWRLREPIDDDTRVSARIDTWGVLVLLCHRGRKSAAFYGDAIMAVDIRPGNRRAARKRRP